MTPVDAAVLSDGARSVDADTGSQADADTGSQVDADTGSQVDANVGIDAAHVPVSATQLAVDGWHTCALLDTGEVRCWGEAAYGQLGYGNTNNIGDNEIPASAGNVNVGGSVVWLAADTYHTCAVLNGGAVRCWGWGGEGKLGYGNTNDIGDNEDPVTAGDIDLGGTAIQVALGGYFTCALLGTGSVRCWGDGGSGKLGYGNSTDIGDDETPSVAGDVDVGGTVLALSAGGSHTCALLDTGAIRCWGYGGNGRLGYGNVNSIGDSETPASAGDVNVGGIVIQVAAGGAHTCALLDTGVVRCWGDGTKGRLGYGSSANIGDDETPASAGDVDVGGSVVQVATGESHTCALLDTGAVRCWGEGANGRLGYGNTTNIGDNESPASAGDVDVGDGTILRVVAGYYHTCVLFDTGAVRCWGFGGNGQLGYGNGATIGDNETPRSAGDVPF